MNKIIPITVLLFFLLQTITYARTSLPEITSIELINIVNDSTPKKEHNNGGGSLPFKGKPLYKSEPVVEESILVFVFKDIKGHWAEEMIKEALARKLISGYPDNTFRPNQPITRMEWISIMVRALSLEGEGEEIYFSDYQNVPEWGRNALELAIREKLVEGYPDGSFRPNDFITRAEIACLIARQMKIETPRRMETTFADYEKIPLWARGEIEMLAKEGILKGRSNNLFEPKELTTRAEATVLLLRMVDNTR
ncbi:MAG TPA: S-layer homology domain-containing protein [Bacillus bacterium]|nr:S-layer homology domain-containing protein [Bacillus sp. (in: firmicutes)]